MRSRSADGGRPRRSDAISAATGSSLGTRGGPRITDYKPSPAANLIVWNNVPYVIDTGYGVTFKLVEAKFPLPALRYTFITHHHSDHNAEFGLLVYNAWATGLQTPVDAYGPAGMRALAQGFWDAYKFDIDTRIADEAGRPAQARQRARIWRGAGDGDRRRQGDGAAQRAPADHRELRAQIRVPGQDRVFSGDTAYFPPLAAFAKGADILVHEVMYGPALEDLVRRNPNAATLMAHLKASHTLTDDVGRIATEAGVKTLVLSHLVPADAAGMTAQTWADAVRPTFKGEIVVAHDLLEIPL